jgi:hypothetical protein
MKLPQYQKKDHGIEKMDQEIGEMVSPRADPIESKIHHIEEGLKRAVVGNSLIKNVVGKIVFKVIPRPRHNVGIGENHLGVVPHKRNPQNGPIGQNTEENNKKQQEGPGRRFQWIV